MHSEFGIPENAPLVVMVSRLQRWKGVHVFVEAAAQVFTRRPEARFLVVGGSLFGLEIEYAKQLEDQVERLGLRGVVQLVGHRSDIFRFYTAADLVVHCSIEPEPFGTVLLEAMACAKAVIATDLGGTREIVQHGTTGLLVASNDHGLLAEQILSLLANPEGRSRMGQAGAKRVRDYLNMDRMTHEVSAVYSEMPSGKSL